MQWESIENLLIVQLLNEWANDGLLQANNGEMLVNDGEMSIWLYIHFTIIDTISSSLTSILPFLAWSEPSFAHLNIIEKLHQLYLVLKITI